MAQENASKDTVFDMADRLFGTYVDDAVAGKVVGVRIDWVPTVSDGETIEEPHVFINDEPAGAVFLRTASYTDAADSLDKATLQEGAMRFNGMMAGLEDAVQYQRDLRSLDEQVNLLAISGEAGYFDAVREDFNSQGFHGIGDGETLSIARSLILQDVSVLGDAAERQDDYNACYSANFSTIQEAFVEQPGAYWVLLGKDSGKVLASGGKGTIPNRDSHIDMELGFEENTFIYLRQPDSAAN